MLPVGLLSLVQAFVADPNEAAIKLSIALPSVAFLVFLWTRWQSKQQTDDEGSPISLPESCLFTILPFFRSRFDFLNWGFKLSGQSIYQFRLLQVNNTFYAPPLDLCPSPPPLNTVIAVSGEPARRDFFTCKGFDLNEGFKVLSGAARRISIIHKRLATSQNEGHLCRLLPKLLEDTARVLDSWGTSASTQDPFECIPKLCFQTSVRSLACSELADDEAVVARLKTLYDTLDSATTPASVLVPWFPSPSMLKKLFATKKIYDIVNRAIEARLRSGVPQDDTLQIMIDSSDDRLVMLGFIMGLLVAGARSTGTTGKGFSLTYSTIRRVPYSREKPLPTHNTSLLPPQPPG
ncbi:hypothetical protein NLI96_g817 [Meripilus lineatus]|uniref:Cytochrome P450 n=1 Tax=Meripilus lineatus TaxID=2056292 RepID=A0AAD5YI63_9APHY|nr:hypothetical protein NLI96_g817 [Physisporinus lineatus]